VRDTERRKLSNKKCTDVSIIDAAVSADAHVNGFSKIKWSWSSVTYWQSFFYSKIWLDTTCSGVENCVRQQKMNSYLKVTFWAWFSVFLTYTICKRCKHSLWYRARTANAKSFDYPERTRLWLHGHWPNTFFIVGYFLDCEPNVNNFVLCTFLALYVMVVPLLNWWGSTKACKLTFYLLEKCLTFLQALQRNTIIVLILAMTCFFSASAKLALGSPWDFCSQSWCGNCFMLAPTSCIQHPFNTSKMLPNDIM